MANNHACPVSQSAPRRDTNDLLQGQRSLFLEGKLLTVATGEGGWVVREGEVVGGWGVVFCVSLAAHGSETGERPKRDGSLVGTAANRTARGSSGQPPGPFPSQ